MSEDDYHTKKLTFRYDKGHNGPFLVMLERSFAEGNQFLHRFCVSKNLRDIPDLRELVGEAHDFKSAGRNRYKLFFHKFESANSFVEQFNGLSIFRDKEVWEAYVPEFRIFKWFVLRGVDDPDFLAGDVAKWLGPYNGSGELPEVVEVQKMKRFVPPDPQGKGGGLQNSKNFKVKFRTTEVPEKATLMMSTVFLSPFVDSPKRCNYCQRYGHIEKYCRDVDNEKKDRVCARCAGSGHSSKECVSDTLKCINCVRENLPETDHAASDRCCPIYEFNKNIKYVMANHNVDKNEAIVKLQKNGGVPPKKPSSYAGAAKVVVDMAKLVEEAKIKKKELQLNKQKREKEKKERKAKKEALQASLHQRLQKAQQKDKVETQALTGSLTREAPPPPSSGNPKRRRITREQATPTEVHVDLPSEELRLKGKLEFSIEKDDEDVIMEDQNENESESDGNSEVSDMDLVEETQTEIMNANYENGGLGDVTGSQDLNANCSLTDGYIPDSFV